MIAILRITDDTMNEVSCPDYVDWLGGKRENPIGKRADCGSIPISLLVYRIVHAKS